VLLASSAAAWVAAVGAFVGPFVGVAGALWLYTKQRIDKERDDTKEELEAVYRQLRAELDANRQIVSRSIGTIEAALSRLPPGIGENEAFHDERMYLAPLFADSWAALTRSDAHRVIPRKQLDELFGYYSAVARGNWLITRLQRFQYRVPILEEIVETLRQVDDEKAGIRVDLDVLETALAPRLAAS
jgi:hypothetical protein